jgi:uncharacterized protein YjdB
MTFMHKLSSRLARLKDRVAFAPTVALAAVVAFGCERPVAITDAGSPLTQFLVAPQVVTLQQNQSQDFTAVGLTAAGDTAPIAVSWSASGGAIDTSSHGGRHYGHYHATTCGDYKVTATSNPGGMQAAASVSVLCPGAVPVDTVVLSAAAARVFVGSAVQLGATAEDSAGNPLSGRTITWTSSNGAVASVNGSGLVTGIAAGTATILATSGGKSGSAAVTVVAVPVATVSVTPATASVAVGSTVALSATPQDSAGYALSGRTVSWATSNAAVATVSQTGVVTGVAAGSATITATSEGKSGTAAVTVSVVPVATVSVTPATASVAVGSTVALSATPKDSAGHALSGRTVSWATSNAAVATVSQAGVVTGVGAGSATITATSEGKSGTAAVTVVVVPVATVSVTPATASVAVGSTVALSATPKDSAGHALSGRAVTWATSNAAVAAVSQTGVVTGVGAGSATISATSEGKSGTAAITVTVPPPAGSCVSVCHYVDAVAGNDANAGTSAAPWRTLQHAADVTNPGDTVIVNDGVYTGGANVVTISRSGTAAGWLVFRAAHLWGAVIDGQNNASAVGIEINGNYVHVEGFEVRYTSRYGIDAYGGSESVGGNHDVDVVQNHVHDVGHICTGDVGGIVGVDAYSDNLVIERNVIHDIGRLGPGEQGCVEPNANWQNHDHGVYHGIGNNVVIRNNVFYNFTHGWAIQRYNGNGAVTTGLTIVNNTFAFPNPWRDGQIIIATGVTNLVIANNIFYQPTTAGVWLDTGGLTNATVSNNIAFGGVTSAGPGATLSANLDNTDPQFVNAGGLDFRVQAGSPAIGVGLRLSIVPNDFTGALRPASGGYTIGAYEFK